MHRIPRWSTKLVREKTSYYSGAMRVNSTTRGIQICAEVFGQDVREFAQEFFGVLMLDTKLKPIGDTIVTVGTLDASLVHPREVFKPAIAASAASILLVHNHPSGDPTPSRQDRDVTQSLKKCGEILGIQVIDHIILACQDDGEVVGLSLVDH